MSETMVEKVARALEPKCRAFGYGDMPLAVAREFARAAIDAMRSPSKEMIAAGNEKIDECIDFWNYDSGSGYSVEQHAAFETFNAMIDAALATLPGET